MMAMGTAANDMLSEARKAAVSPAVANKSCRKSFNGSPRDCPTGQAIRKGDGKGAVWILSRERDTRDCSRGAQRILQAAML